MTLKEFLKTLLEMIVIVIGLAGAAFVALVLPFNARSNVHTAK